MSKLSDQVKKAQSATRFASVMQRDAEKRPKSVLVPGSNAKLYHVILRRDPALSVELNISTNSGLVKPNFAYKHITYHALAAIMVAAKERGYRVRWCASAEDARNLANLGGKAFTVTNHDNHDVRLYGVYVK